MINLDQVRTLEWKVKQAVQLIVHLRRENDTLRGRLSDTEVRLQELEGLLEAFKSSQSELESGIRSALEELDNLEGAAPAVAASVAGTSTADSVSYPPVAEPEAASAPGEAFATDEPSALFERTPVFATDDPGEPTEANAPPSFEEEYAALAAEEAASAAPVPQSAEWEAEASAPEAEAPPVEEKRPEQPGLGIF